jgi:hypothetical protein
MDMYEAAKGSLAHAMNVDGEARLMALAESAAWSLLTIAAALDEMLRSGLPIRQ